MRTIEDIIEGESGSAYYRALLVADLQSVAEHAVTEFEHDEGMVAFVWACRKIAGADVLIGNTAASATLPKNQEEGSA